MMWLVMINVGFTEKKVDGWFSLGMCINWATGFALALTAYLLPYAILAYRQARRRCEFLTKLTAHIWWVILERFHIHDMQMSVNIKAYLDYLLDLYGKETDAFGAELAISWWECVDIGVTKDHRRRMMIMHQTFKCMGSLFEAMKDLNVDAWRVA